MSVRVEFFYDLSSPWTRLAFHNFRTGIEGRDVAVIWRPFLVGGVFNAVNQSVYESRANPDNPKFRLSFKWLKEWARLAGLRMHFPSVFHPVKSVHAMRFCCALEDRPGDLLAFSEAAFEAYFGDARNIDDPEVLEDIARSIGLDGAGLRAASASEAVKVRLRETTDEAIARGAYGSPTIFVDGAYMYFGNDQLPLVLQRIDMVAAA